MKTQVIAIIAVIICITSALFINPINSALVATATIQTSGTIIQTASTTKLTVILRSVCITDLNPNQIDINTWVDNYVRNHNYATTITISDMHQYGIWWYGYSFSNTSGTWMGWNYQQLKLLIDRFHENGWKVGIETTGIAWNNQQEYNYITTEHPELAYTDAKGMRATGVDNATALTKNPGYNRVIPDFFAKFSTNDITNNIHIGTRLIDLYTERLSQMITDGLQWDFWFGTDGWNGFNLQGYYWGPNSVNPNTYYSFSSQEIAEYTNSTNAILPTGWSGMTNTQRAAAISANTTIANSWWQYWQIRFAQMYAQIRQSFISAGRQNSFYTIGTVDLSSEPKSAGNLSPVGMYNMTLLTQYNAIDFFYTDQESTHAVEAQYGLGREQAYCAALAKMQTIKAKPIIGLQLVDWLGKPFPLWEVEQEYLSQAVNYVWFNGERFQVSDPSIVMLQYPTTDGWSTWSQSDVTALFNFIETTSNLLSNSQPVWLGPVYPIPDTKSGALGMAWWGMNFSIAQWAWTSNLANNPQYINPSMGTFLMDESLGDSGPQLLGLFDKMVNDLWATDKLNIWYYECRGMDWGISRALGGYELEAQKAFHIQYNPGASLTYTIPNNLNDQTAQWIAKGYEGTDYSVNGDPSYQGIYVAQPGFVTIASYTYDQPNRIAAGYYTNSTSGNFLLTHMPSGLQSRVTVLPRSMINKMLYWVSDCPVNTSESLIDLKILIKNQMIILPMTDQKNVGNTFNVEKTVNTTLNLQKLLLEDPSFYHVYWLSNPTAKISVNNWSNLNVTLMGGADTLVIEPK